MPSRNIGCFAQGRPPPLHLALPIFFITGKGFSKTSSLFSYMGWIHMIGNWEKRLRTFGEIGGAAYYRPPYIPTACYGNDVSALSSSKLFASAGEWIWDNGAACGRLYNVSCVSAQTPRTCKVGQTILVRIVDRAQTSVSRPSMNGAVLVLSTTAFRTIADESAVWVNVEFVPV